MMQLGAIIKKLGAGDLSWLGSRHGVAEAQTATLNIEKLTDFKAAGFVPSGTPLKFDESSKKFEPVKAQGDKLAGFLLTDQSITGEGDVVAAILEHGRIRTANLPKGAFDVTTLTETNPHFIFVKEGE